MTDLELTRLCAEAMGLTVRESASKTALHLQADPAQLLNAIFYDPLNDDEQAMALLKKVRLGVQVYEGGWLAWGYDSPESDSPIRIKKTESLNRAIVECCARIQAEKSK
jgi:hypothetical protein